MVFVKNTFLLLYTHLFSYLEKPKNEILKNICANDSLDLMNLICSKAKKNAMLDVVNAILDFLGSNILYLVRNYIVNTKILFFLCRENFVLIKV